MSRSSIDWGADGAVLQLQLGTVQRSLIGGDVGLHAFDGGTVGPNRFYGRFRLAIRLFSGVLRQNTLEGELRVPLGLRSREFFLSHVSGKIRLRGLKLCFIFRQSRFGLNHLRLVWARIDNEQTVAFAYIGAFLEIDDRQFPADLSFHRYCRIGLDITNGLDFNRNPLQNRFRNVYRRGLRLPVHRRSFVVGTPGKEKYKDNDYEHALDYTCKECIRMQR